MSTHRHEAYQSAAMLQQKVVNVIVISHKLNCAAKVDIVYG